MDHQLKRSGTTRINTTRRSFKWTIENFDLQLVAIRHASDVTSPSFQLDDDADFIRAQLCLKRNPFAKDENYDLLVRFSTKREDSNCRGYIAFSIVVEDGTLVNASNVAFDASRSLSGAKVVNNFFREDFVRKHGKEALIPRNRLTIEFVANRCSLMKTTASMVDCVSTSSGENVSDDFDKFFDAREFSDVTIVVDECKFCAHKLMLAARSPVFAAMFEFDKRINTGNSVEINDVDSSTMRELLRYLYTGRIDDLGEIMDENLLIAADKYQVLRLKDACQERLTRRLDVRNAIPYVLFADKYRAMGLKSAALEFVVSHSQEIFENEKNGETSVLSDILSALEV